MAKIIRTDVIYDDNTVVPCYPLPDGTPPPTGGTDPDFTLKTGHTLFLEAPASLITGGSENLDMFAWDFGDTSTGSQFNTVKGFNAAHLFDTAGTYTVTLTHTPNGLTSAPGSPTTTTWTVLVADSAQQNIYVSNTSGNDGNPGTMASPIKSITKALSMAASFDRIYLKRGDVWRIPNDGTTNYSYVITQNGLEIRDYGTGNLPIVEAPVQTISIFNVWGEDVVVRNVYFRQLDPGYARSGIRVLTPNRKNLTAVGCQTEKVCFFVNGDHLPATKDSDPITDGVLLLNCSDSPGESCCRNQWVFGAYSHWCLYGCTAYDSIYEATLRFWGNQGWRMVSINGGTYGNRDASQTRYGAAGIVPNASNIGKGAILLQRGSYGWIEGVTMVSDVVLYSDGGIYLGPLGLESGDTQDPTGLTDHVVCNNNVDQSYNTNRADNSQPVQIHLYAGLHRASITNNVGFQRVYVNGFDAAVNRGMENLFIRNNTTVYPIVNNSPEATVYG